MLKKSLPFLNWWSIVNRKSLRDDIVAGITGAIIVLPQGVAFAILAGLPPEYGLYTAVVPVVIAALFGSSHHLMSGPTTSLSIVIFATLSPIAEPGSANYIILALTLTFLAGVFQLLLGFARLGTLVNFISHSVITGFAAGAAILVVTSQLNNVFGLQMAQSNSIIQTWFSVFNLLPDINGYALAIAGATLTCAISLQIYSRKLPGLLISMVVGSLLSLLLGGAQHGIDLVGSLPVGLPPLSMPDFSGSTIQSLISGSLVIALLGLMEAVSIARIIASRSQQHLDPSQEFIGQGLSNIFGSFFSSYASSGSFTRSSVNYNAGARTPLSAVFSALAIIAVLLVLAPLAAYLPMPALGAILLVAAYRLIDFKQIRKIIQVSRSETAVLITTFISVLFVSLEFGIYIGVILSLALHLNRISHPRIVGRVPDPNNPAHQFVSDTLHPDCPQLRILRIDGSLFFGSVNHIEQKLWSLDLSNPQQRYTLLICTGVNFIDIAGAEFLTNEAQRRRTMGGDLHLCSVKKEVRELLDRGGYADILGKDHFHTTKNEAINSIFPHLQRDICSACRRRIFKECRGVVFE